jgi:hypothetical protein
MRIYDTNLSNFDSLAIKTCLLFYLFASAEPNQSSTVAFMLEQLISSMANVTLFSSQLRSVKKGSKCIKVANAAMDILASLTSFDFRQFEANAEAILTKVLPQKINNDRDLYRVYAKSAKDMPTVVNVDIDITFLEALCKFSSNFQLEDFMILNVAKPNFSPFRFDFCLYSPAVMSKLMPCILV